MMADSIGNSPGGPIPRQDPVHPDSADGRGPRLASADGLEPAGAVAPGSPDPAARGVLREAVAVFDSAEALQAAIDALYMGGFGQHELSVMANDEVLKDKLGHVPAEISTLAHDADTPRQAPVSPEEVGTAQGASVAVPAYIGAVAATGLVVATGGTALAAAAAALAGAGAAGGLGGLIAGWVGRQREAPLRQHLEKGGLLLWVNLRDAGREAQALEILRPHVSRPVELHDIPQATGSAGA